MVSLAEHRVLDGGGIRGYSSLLILRELMEYIYEEETRSLSEEEKARHSSYHPHEYIPCVRNNQDNDGDSHDWMLETDQGVTAAGTRNTGCGVRCRYVPAHYFDFVGGTSTGGLISIMLGRLRMSVEDCITEYATLSESIFGHPRRASFRGPIPWPRDKYDGNTIRNAVVDVIERRMSPAERKAGAGNFNSPPGLCRT